MRAAPGDAVGNPRLGGRSAEGAGEIVLNMMNQTVRNGYDLQQLAKVRAVCHVPLIASGGAGTMEHSSKPSATPTLDGAGGPGIPQTDY